VAPSQHSLIIDRRDDAERILGTLFDRHIDLRKLILRYCTVHEDGTGILSNIVAFYPDLEVLTLQGCSKITSAGYSVIPRLKKLIELNLSNCQVNYMSNC
jgi:Ran GTPase-activating protein (RanGAP) involved in mRNA processing and transport